MKYVRMYTEGEIAAAMPEHEVSGGRTMVKVLPMTAEVKLRDARFLDQEFVTGWRCVIRGLDGGSLTLSAEDLPQLAEQIQKIRKYVEDHPCLSSASESEGQA